MGATTFEGAVPTTGRHPCATSSGAGAILDRRAAEHQWRFLLRVPAGEFSSQFMPFLFRGRRGQSHRTGALKSSCLGLCQCDASKMVCCGLHGEGSSPPPPPDSHRSGGCFLVAAGRLHRPAISSRLPVTINQRQITASLSPGFFFFVLGLCFDNLQTE